MADADETTVDEAASEEAAGDVVEPERVHGALVTHGPDGLVVLHPDRDALVDLVEALGADGFHQCLDVAGVDYLRHPGRNDLPEGVAPERFEVVVHLMSHTERRRLRIRVQVPADDPTCPSLFDLHPGVEAMEREAYDLFGIAFDGHPDLTRILMPEDWTGHPLRKDYAIGAIPVQFKGAPAPR
ncbi:MAG: NADH-quinone oxidoreductase subunit C [Acidimicrobiales bacterium]|nr:NADH-quinone oxidoreductase subunit C [Acidimicrobiales bacterium]MCB1016174.1 NADH-quinone oxidoreductase subunit C [Acidimicrobiales bacterium]MCB9372538.1 NADH-quinone oxidoreductase subunit C [Microthrixaceae bacterium]